MLYFAYGSNLHHKQMKMRCRDSKYLGCYTLKGYRLFFRNHYYGGGVADVQKKKNSYVLGAIYEISKRDEKKLDIYEQFPKTYIKKYLKSGSKTYSYTISVETVESHIAILLTKVQNKYKKFVDIGSYPFFRLGKIGVSIVIRSTRKKILQSCHKYIIKMLKKKKYKIFKGN